MSLCLCGKSNGFFFGHSNPLTVLHIASPDWNVGFVSPFTNKMARRGGHMNRAWIKLTFLAVIISAALPLMGLAQGVNQRQQNQQARIRQGVRSGELTRREAGRLQAQQARIRVNEAYARRSGGEFTTRERARIQRQLNRSSNRVYRQKHDRQDRNWR
jgi:hypothetical protein